MCLTHWSLHQHAKRSRMIRRKRSMDRESLAALSYDKPKHSLFWENITISQALLIHKRIPQILLHLIEPSGEHSEYRRKGVLPNNSAKLYRSERALSRIVHPSRFPSLSSSVVLPLAAKGYKILEITCSSRHDIDQRYSKSICQAVRYVL